jgi:hypothetical protein
MKTMLKLLAFLMLSFFPTFFATANPESAPGIQKKTLEIIEVSVVTSATSATISWQTNLPCTGVLETVGGAGRLDEKTGTRHSITIPSLVPGLEYPFRIVVFSDRYGSDIYVGTFTL